MAARLPSWICIADTKAEARSLVAREMENSYKILFGRFEKYTPYGTPEDVANYLLPYIENDCSIMNLKVVAVSGSLCVHGAGEIAKKLRANDYFL